MEANSKKSFIQVQLEATAAIQTCYDPEIPVNIYELGLIYEVKVSLDLEVNVLMTLTTAFCPAAQTLPLEVKQKIEAIEGVKNVNVEVTFDPPWTQDMMSEAAKLELGFM